MGVPDLPTQLSPHHRRGDDVIGRAAGALTVVAALGAALAPLPRGAIERRYAVGFYAWLQPWVTAVSDTWPWAVLDPLLMGAVGAIIAVGVRAMRRRRPGGGSARRVNWRRPARSAAVVAAAAFLVFQAMWGLNYRRAPVEQRVAFDASRVTTARVVELAEIATSELNRLHGSAHAASWPELPALPDSFGGQLAATARRLALGWAPRPGRPKPTLLGPYFRWAGIAGMTNPFGLEVLPSPDTLPFERHAVVAHEWAHLAGFAHEAEAGFVGWLMCMSGDVQARYSGWISVWPSLVAAVPKSEAARIVDALAAGPRQDLRAVAARNARAVPVVRDSAWRGYDVFLRSQRVPDGVASYEGVVRLMAGTKW